MKKKITYSILFILLLAALILTFGLRWAVNVYGNVSLEEIIFHINMPMEGVSSDFVGDVIKNAILPAFLTWGLFIFFSVFPRHTRFHMGIGFGEKAGQGSRFWDIQFFPLRFSPPVALFGLVCWLLLIFFSADDMFAIIDYVQSKGQISTLIEEEYVSPASVRITFPEEKRNLICIYIESGESSAQDEENGGIMPINYIPELTRIAKENISFSHSDKIEGAAAAPGCSWTIAGMVAETAGLPLLLPNGYNNKMSGFDTFLPGAVTLGEILEKQGYHNYYMAGSDFTFGGRRNYFSQHGDYTVYDLLWARMEGKIPHDYKVFWGFEDEKLFSYAKEKLVEIAAKEEPFNFSVLTVDTHVPDGYLCELCPSDYSNQYANVWVCASRQISDFVSWIQEQDFYDNTMVYICGDHLSMNKTFYGAQTEDEYLGQNRRKVYNAFLNTVITPGEEEEHNRRFTTMDMFPTLLAGLGADIEGERLGLGTNLFSGEKTLAERLGYETLFAELQKKSPFYEEALLFGTSAREMSK